MQQAHLTIISIGTDKFDWIESGLGHYKTLLKRYAKLSQLSIPAPKKQATDAASSRRQDAELFRPVLAKHPSYIALTDAGSSYTSHTMAEWLTRTLSTTGGKLSFVIGGPYGLEPDLIAGAKGTLSLSPLTYSHQLVRLVLLEQLFRAFSIAAGDPYHK